MRNSFNIADGFTHLEGGMSSGLSPEIIAPNQVAFAINATMRRGYVRTRVKLKQIDLQFQGDSDAYDWFNSHAVNGQSYYSSASGAEMIVGAAGGRMFAFTPSFDSAQVTDVTGTTRNDQIQTKTWFCQAAQYLVGQDGVSPPWIFDGVAGKRASDSPYQSAMPTGKQMAYINDRIFIVLPNGREIAPGDLAYENATSVLQFTEIAATAAQGGQPLSIPLELGPITALVPTAQLDTQAGQGVLLACQARSICSINPVVNRSQWPTIQLQNVALVGNGFTSDGCAIVNGDVWGRSPDGWRSYVMARREFGSWGNTPQSYEIQRILDEDSKNLLDHASFVYFDNRIIGTCSPVSVPGGVYHRGMVALDFVNIANLSTKSPPAYDGLWTGIQPYGLVTGYFNNVERCFAFCRNQDGTNSLWEITTEYGDDNDDTKIPCVIETRSYDFQQPAIWKQLEDGELWVDQLVGKVDFDVKYRPDQYPCWLDWWASSQCAKDRECNENPLDPMACQTPVTFQEQYRPRMVMGQPPNRSEPVLDKLTRIGYLMQFRIQWTGNVRLKQGIFYATKKDPQAQTTK